MVYEIHADSYGDPYLKRVERKRYPGEPRGQWVEVGHRNNNGIENVIRRNQEMGHIVLEDDQNYIRILILTD